MINLKSLIDFLPPIFKNTDTYKVGGKGILERFLEVCGEYLEDDITPDIENTLDIIDIKNLDPIYLNYLWELFGEIPFGSNIAIDKEQWDRYYDGTLSKEELTQLSKNWVIPKDGIISLDETRIRTLLKYSLTLLKIRGTKKFFETLFEIYGISCTISDVYDNDEGLYAKLSKLDTDSAILDNTTTDYVGHCNDCLSIKIDISTNYMYSDISGILIVGKDDTYFATGGKQTTVNTYEGVSLYNSYYSNHDELSAEDLATLKGFVLFRRTMERLFDKYLPCNVKPIITYDGITPDDKYKLSLQYVSENTYLTDQLKEVIIKVDISSNWPYNNHKFGITNPNSKPQLSEKEYASGSEIKITSSGDYMFYSVEHPNQYDLVSVTYIPTTKQDVYRICVTDVRKDSNFSAIGYPKMYHSNISGVDTNIEVYKNGMLLDGEVVIVVDGRGNISEYTTPSYKYHQQYPIEQYNEVVKYYLKSNPLVNTQVEFIPIETSDSSFDISTEFGLPYGVSAECGVSHSFLEENEDGELVQKEDVLMSTGESYGEYGALGYEDRTQVFVSNHLGNVISIYPQEKTREITEILLMKLTPWAYKYNQGGSIIKERVDLKLVDIWYSHQPLDQIESEWDPFEKSIDTYDSVILSDELKFRKIATVDISENNTLSILDLPGDGYNTPRNGGGVLLFHPNTEELRANGIEPNFGDNYYSNFLIMVIPTKNHENSYSTFRHLHQYFPSNIDYNEVNSCMFSPYSRNTEYLIPGKLAYDKIITSSNHNNIENNKPLVINKLNYKLDNLVPEDIEEDVEKFTRTKIVIFNITPYNSNTELYTPYEGGYEGSGQGNSPKSVNFEYNLHQCRLPIIFMDRTAPLVHTQYVARKTYIDTEDGLYIQPILDDQASYDIWREVPIDSNTKLARLSSDNSNKLTVQLFAWLSTGPAIAKFKFIHIKNRSELTSEYSIVDNKGNIYLPNVKYEVSSLGDIDYYTNPALLVPTDNNDYKLTLEYILDSYYYTQYEVIFDKDTYYLPNTVHSTIHIPLSISKPIAYINYHEDHYNTYIVRTDEAGTVLDNIVDPLDNTQNTYLYTTDTPGDYYFGVYDKDKEEILSNLIKITVKK